MTMDTLTIYHILTEELGRNAGWACWSVGNLPSCSSLLPQSHLFPVLVNYLHSAAAIWTLDRSAAGKTRIFCVWRDPTWQYHVELGCTGAWRYWRYYTLGNIFDGLDIAIQHVDCRACIGLLDSTYYYSSSTRHGNYSTFPLLDLFTTRLDLILDLLLASTRQKVEIKVTKSRELSEKMV